MPKCVGRMELDWCKAGRIIIYITCNQNEWNCELRKVIRKKKGKLSMESNSHIQEISDERKDFIIIASRKDFEVKV